MSKYHTDEHYRFWRERLWADVQFWTVARQLRTEKHASPRTLLEHDLRALVATITVIRSQLRAEQPSSET